MVTGNKGKALHCIEYQIENISHPYEIKYWTKEMGRKVFAFSNSELFIQIPVPASFFPKLPLPVRGKVLEYFDKITANEETYRRIVNFPRVHV